MKTLLAIAVLSASVWAQITVTDLAPAGMLTASGTLTCADNAQSGTMLLTNTSGKEIVTIEADRFDLDKLRVFDSAVNNYGDAWLGSDSGLIFYHAGQIGRAHV